MAIHKANIAMPRSVLSATAWFFASTSRCCPNQRVGNAPRSSTLQLTCAAHFCEVVQARPAWSKGCWMPRASPCRTAGLLAAYTQAWLAALHDGPAQAWLIPCSTRPTSRPSAMWRRATVRPLAPDRHCAGCRAQGAHRGQRCLAGSAERAPAGPARRLPWFYLAGFERDFPDIDLDVGHDLTDDGPWLSCAPPHSLGEMAIALVRSC